jgi:hypothetical protein
MRSLYYKAKHKTKRWLYQNAYYDKVGLKPTVFLAGSARSGTTWVSNIVQAGGDFRTLFEPFHFNRSVYGKAFLYHEYIRPDGGTTDQLAAIKSVVNGQIRCYWEDQDNRCILPNARLIKDIHSNLRLKWIKIHFPKIRFLYLIRYPLDVASSRVKLNWNSNAALHLCQQQKLIEDFPQIQTARDFLTRNTSDPLLAHIFIWSVEQIVALSQLSAQDVKVLAYEDFIFDTKGTVSDLYQWLELTGRLPTESLLSQRSWTSGSPRCPQAHLRALTPDALQLLKIFRLEDLYDSTGRPAVSFASLPDRFV